MKKSITLLFTFFLIPLFLYSQPTPEEIKTSIDNGVVWLVDQQNPDGSWGTSEVIAQTGFALMKLTDYAQEGNTVEPTLIDNAVNYLLSMAKTHGAGTGITITTALCYHHETYNAAVGLMAIANYCDPTAVIVSTNTVVDGLTYAQLMTEMVTYFEWSQHADGGWTYEPCNAGNLSDNSHSGWVVLALRYAEAKGIMTPAAVKTKLSSFIDLIQDDLDGSSWYRTDWHWPNALKQGNLLLEMAFVGDNATTTRVVKALDYLDASWNDPTNDDINDEGWKDPQAMYCLMKGFSDLGIETITIGTDEVNWYDAFVSQVVGTQTATGYWNSVWDSNIDGSKIPATCWALFVLEKVIPPPPIVVVDLDVHPSSWPNPLQIKSKGLTPVAIVGTPQLDVTGIDPESLLLEGVAPVKWLVTDTTAPVEDDTDGCHASTTISDGIMDLVFYFNTQELVAALKATYGPLTNGQMIVVTVKGQMKDPDGRELVGDDCIRIIMTKSASIEPDQYALMQNYPNPFSSKTMIIYQIPEDTQVFLKVFNSMGQEIRTLVNNKQAPGSYSVEFDTGNLTTGQYFYRLSTSGFTDTKSMVIIH